MFMSDERDNNILQRGQPSLSERYREDTKAFRLLLPISQHEYIMTVAKKSDISAAEYIRRLIAKDMDQNG